MVIRDDNALNKTGNHASILMYSQNKQIQIGRKESFFKQYNVDNKSVTHQV